MVKKMKKINFILFITVITSIISGCGWFDDAKELAKQLEYYKKYASNLERKISDLNTTIDNLKKDNSNLKSQLQRYKDAHNKMIQ